MRKFLLLTLLAIGLLGACAGNAGRGDLGARLAAANLMASSLAASLSQATEAGVIAPRSATAAAALATLDAIELALEGAGNAWRAGLPDLAERNLGAAENQMAGLGPLLPHPTGGQ